MRVRVEHVRNSGLVRNAGWMLAGQGLRVLVQAVYFVLIARALGVTQYGTFSGVAALVAVLAPFATWGSGNILVKNVARDRNSFERYWGAAIRMTLLSAAVLSALALSASLVFLPSGIPFALIASVVLADLLFARAVDLGGLAFQAFQLLSRTAATQFLISALRLVAAVCVYLATKHTSALTWGYLYLGASAISAGVTLGLVHRELGRPDWRARLAPAELKEGFQFSVTNSALSIYNDIDKTMLARLATLDAAGFYAAGYRILDVSFVPIRAILAAAYSRFFAAGQAGVRGTFALARRLLPVALCYSLLASLAIFLAAPLVPAVLGADYANCVQVLRFLCVLPLLRTVQYFAADSLTGADHQGIRSLMQAAVAIFNVLLNLWLIPRYSWRGAVWSTLASDGSLAVALWITLGVLVARSPTGAPSSERSSAETTLAEVTAA